MRSVSASLSTFLDTSTIGLYQHLVTITLADGTVLRWTDNESDLVVGGNTFTSGGTGTVPIVQVGGRTDSAGTEIGDLELTLLCGETARVAGVPIPAAVVADIFDRATVKVERVFGASAVDVSMGTMRLFDGVVAETDPSSTIVKLSLVDPRDELKIELPRTPIQPPCTNQVFDSQCDPDGTLKTARTYGATVAVGSTAWVVRTNRAESSGYFDLGVLTFDSNTTTVALRNVKRAVSSFAQANGAFTLSEALPATPVSGDHFIVHPGCNKHFLDSGGCPKFGNQVHFRGCPLLPAEASDGRRVAKVNPDFTSNVTEWNGIGGNVTPPDLVLPLVYGRQKIKGQVVYRRDYDIHYTTLIVAFCEGPIIGTRRFWVGDTFSPTIPLAGGFSQYYPGNEPDVFRLGTRPTQAGWNWLGPAAGGVDPTYAGVHYPGVAYWAVKRRPLPAGTTESYELEVDGFLSNASDSGKDGDAHPASILGDTTYGILKNSQYGAGFRWPVVTDLGSDYTAASSARRYLTAAGLYLSPIIDSKRSAIDILQEILESCNCSCRIADGALQIVPLGDIEFTQNGVTYTPDTTVQYALDEDDFITNGAEDPVTVRRPSTEKVCNIIPVTWTERNPTVSPRQNSTSYNVDDWFTVPASDGKTHTYKVVTAGTSGSSQPSAYTGTWGETITDGTLQAVEKGVARDSSYAYVTRSLEDPEPVDVSVNGPRRGDAVSLPMVCLPEAALTISRLRAQRSVKRRNTYVFKLGWRFSRLQPLDYVRISDSKFNLVDVVVRIVSISEDGDVLTVEAEDAPLGMSHAVAHTTQSSETTFSGVPWVEPARADLENVPAGSVTGDHIADGAVTGGKIAANAVDQSKVQDAAISASKIMNGVVDALKLADGSVSAAKIVGGAVDVDKLAQGQGLNLLPNGDFSAWDSGGSGIPKGWTEWTDLPNKLPSGANFAGGSWSLLGNVDQYNGQYLNTPYLHEGAPAGGIYDDWNSPAIPVVAGKRYAASVYTGAHRARGKIYVGWYDSAGTGIGHTDLDLATQVNDEEATGGTTIAGYKRIYTVATAPTGATSAKVALRKYATKPAQPDSWLFLCRAQFEEVGANATAPGPWVPPAANIITAERIVAGAVVAGKIAANAVGTNELAANSVVAGKIAAGAVGADKIAANAITAKNLTITNFDNLWPNPGAENAPPSGYVVSPNNDGEYGFRSQQYDHTGYMGWVRRLSDPSAEMVCPLTLTASEGDRFYLSWWGRRWTSGNICGFAWIAYGSDGTDLGWHLVSSVSSDVWQQYQGVLGPMPARTARVFIYAFAQPGVTMDIDDIYLRRMAEGTIIVDGAITADKLAANSVTADKLAANSITAAKIAAGEIKTSNYDETGGVPQHGAKLDHTGTALKVAPGNLLLGNKTLDLLLGTNINGAVMRIQRTSGGVLSCTAGWGHTGYKLTNHVDVSPEMVMISSPAAIRVVRCHLVQKWANGAILLAFTTPTAQLVGSEVPLMVPVVVQPNYTSPGGPYPEYPYVDIAPRNPANGAWLDPAAFAWEFVLMVLAPGAPA